MAVIAAAQLLDELMGRNRNVAPNEKFKEVNWEDAEYCKFFLVKFCPHDLFVNTRNDLGACPKVHDEEARKLFEKAKPIHHRKLQYQEDFLRFCASMMNDVERRIIKGKQRLALNASARENPPPSVNEEQINILNDKIEDLEAQAERAGTEGNVEHAQGILKLCDQLKEERDALLRPECVLSSTAELAAAQEKQMEVCEVCGAFLIVGDAQQRLEDHLMGKQHMGFSRMKTAVDEITEAVREAREMLYGGRSTDKRDREKDRVKDFSRKEKLKKERDYEKELEKARSEREREEKEKENERDRRAREKLKMEELRNERRETHRDRESHREKDKHRERDRERHRDREKEERRHKDTSRHRYSHHRRKH